ncbi:MAG: ATP-binding cassette domain-containing protein [Paracoccaceae bacterium]|jgi:ATP-binding cassette subfamily C protein CydD|nr:ATP-binding cassette domain-containing protein [Paracoccaceae bacterium]MDP7184457.1 ATP-binding cassette domain-containing protein [Paracoccaceae bacterium]
MTKQKQQDPGKQRLSQIDSQARPDLRKVALLQTLAGAIWPVQALAIAYVIQGWVTGQDINIVLAISGYVLAGAARALLTSLSGRIAYAAADKVLKGERQKLLERETRRIEHNVSSAALAALAVEKLPHLVPHLTRYVPAMTQTMVLPLLFIALVASVSWAAALALLLTGPLIPVFMAVIGIRARAASDRQMKEISDLNSILVDRLAALSDLRLLNAARQSERVFAGQANRLHTRTMGVLRVAFLSSTMLEFFSALGIVLVAIFVGFSLLGRISWGVWGAPLDVGQGVFLLLMVPEFFRPLRELSLAWHDRASAASVAAELAALEADQSPSIVGLGEKGQRSDGSVAIALTGAALKRDGREILLPDLDISAGEAVVISGPSGSGKSTCLKAVAGMLPLTSGALFVDGQIMSDDVADAWRARLAWVPQRIHFRDISLREFLNADDDTQIADALAKANAVHIVERLPGGLDARLGESGAGVSGGEARRLMLARALLSGADVVLADEPTADLDRETADKIISTLRRLADNGAAVLVASHDPDLITSFDRSIKTEIT